MSERDAIGGVSEKRVRSGAPRGAPGDGADAAGRRSESASPSESVDRPASPPAGDRADRDTGSRVRGAGAAASARLSSLDAFRGLTILGMLLVNNVALDEATPRHLTHADWSGRVHFADLVFPWFLLIVGVALPFSFASHRRKGVSALGWLGKALWRTVCLVLLGMLVDSTVARQPVLGLGVLQLIGLAYLVGALVIGAAPSWRVLIAAVLLAGHWALIRFAPVPGLGPGRFTPEENAIRHINETYLVPFGLKGLLSVIPTGALVLIGSAAGDLLRGRFSPWRKAAALAVGGVALTAIGLLWSFDLPMNKPLWTASYILFTGGLGLAVLCALYIVVDIVGPKALAYPLVVPGANAILAYVAPILVKVDVLQTWTVPAAAGRRVMLDEALQRSCYVTFGRVEGGWFYTGAFILFWWLILWWLYRKQVFLRV